MYVIEKKKSIVCQERDVDKAIEYFLSAVGSIQNADETRVTVKKFLTKDGQFQWGTVCITKE